MDEYVIRDSGERLTLDSLLAESSFDLFQSELHYGICQAAASRLASDEMLLKIIENLYALKSKHIRKVTALASFVGAGVTIKAACLSKTTIQLLSSPDWMPKRVRATASEPKLITRKQVLLVLLKAVSHRLFRFFGARRIRGPEAIRAWVDVTLKMYEAEMSKAFLLVYPFPLSLRRQLAFLKGCRKRGQRFSLYGLPYSVWGAMKAVVGNKCPEELGIAILERDANERHATDLVGMGVKCLFTSDEFEVASFVLHRALSRSTVRVVNTAHGVGQYCPWVFYSEFRVITQTQHRFYSRRAPRGMQVTLLRRSHVPEHVSYTSKRSLSVAFVLIHQPFSTGGLRAEAHAQQMIDVALASIANEFGVQYFIKLHPNARSRAEALGSFWGRLTWSWDELKGYRPIFLTINSSCFFDLKGEGPVLVYLERTFNPSLYFDGRFLGFNLASLRSLAEILLDDAAWCSAASLHAEDNSLEIPQALKAYEYVQGSGPSLASPNSDHLSDHVSLSIQVARPRLQAR